MVGFSTGRDKKALAVGGDGTAAVPESLLDSDGTVQVDENGGVECNGDSGVERNGDSKFEERDDIVEEQNEDGNEQGSEGEEEEEEEGEEEEGWITPENFQEVCEAMGGVLEVEPQEIAVGCVTTDFAMQVRR